MPETIRRAIAFLRGKLGSQRHCLTQPEVLREYCGNRSLDVVLLDYLRRGKELYSALVDAGIPWQDARRVLPIGTMTYLHIIYNYVSLRGVLANRLEHIMDWEINCVAQLMRRELYIHCPRILVDNCQSHSDRQGKAAYAALDSWPPDGKYPTRVNAKDRKHRQEQNPYWVLAPESMRGGPIKWIATDGVYPETAR
jgi:thymidylate synthase ThyX